MNHTGAVRSCPMCRGKPGAWRSTIRKGAAKFEIASCISCRFVYVLNPQGETFHPVQAAPAEVPEKARHRQIKRVCDHHLVRQPRVGWDLQRRRGRGRLGWLGAGFCPRRSVPIRRAGAQR